MSGVPLSSHLFSLNKPDISLDDIIQGTNSGASYTIGRGSRREPHEYTFPVAVLWELHSPRDALCLKDYKIIPSKQKHPPNFEEAKKDYIMGHNGYIRPSGGLNLWRVALKGDSIEAPQNSDSGYGT